MMFFHESGKMPVTSPASLWTVPERILSVPPTIVIEILEMLLFLCLAYRFSLLKIPMEIKVDKRTGIKCPVSNYDYYMFSFSIHGIYNVFMRVKPHKKKLHGIPFQK
jgi:hypothetical protein